MTFIETHRGRWSVAHICRTLEFSERTFYAARSRPPSARAVTDQAHKVEIRRVFQNNYRVYGARRVWKQLAREGHRVARCTVERLMADMDIRGVQRGKKAWTAVVDHSAPRAPDLVERRFTADRPNQLWLADITHASTWEGWLYVGLVSDAYSRAIVGYQIATHLRTDLVLDALEMAIWRRDLTYGELVHHSDVLAANRTRAPVSSAEGQDLDVIELRRVRNADGGANRRVGYLRPSDFVLDRRAHSYVCPRRAGSRS